MIVLRRNIRSTAITAWVILVSLCTLAFAAHLLYSVYCIYTHGDFELMDYGVYTNMIWNSGHGFPFRMLIDKSYLYTHLSFTLALLGPLFRIWDSPMLLILVQWLFLVSGCAVLCLTARRHKLPGEIVAAVGFFYVAYVLSQRVLIYEFHGLSTYLLLVPWLYFCLSFNKPWAWAPLLLILGVREDAFIFLLPLLVYFAVKDRSKNSYAMLAVALGYGLLAVFFLYPAINDVSILERRGRYLDPGRLARGFSIFTETRLHGLLVFLLPLAAWFSRKARPAVIFPAAGFLVCMLSRHPAQQSLANHYSPPVLTMLAVGLVESATMMRESGILKAGQWRNSGVRSFALVAVTIAIHLYTGYLIFGGDNCEVYMKPNIKGRAALYALPRIPREGILLTERRLSAYTANRRDILTWNLFFDSKYSSVFDIVFLEAAGLADPEEGRLVDDIRNGSWGVTYFDGNYVIAERGASTSKNRRVLDAFEYGSILIPCTPGHAGRDIVDPSGGACRYWEGVGHRAPVTLSYGMDRILGPGDYEAIFYYRAAEPESVCVGNWGVFSLHYLESGDVLAENDVEHRAVPAGRFDSVVIPFSVEKEAKIEIRITGGDAELWLYWMYFRKRS